MPDNIDPRTLEHPYDPRVGNCGRGHQHITAEDVDLTGYKRFSVPGLMGVAAIEIPLVESSFMWTGYIREENGRHFIVGFERPMTEEERTIERPKFSTSGGVLA